MMDFTETIDLVSVLFVGVALRSIISLHPYSGEGQPPMFGDYEAQRHWQEITVNLHIKDWYTNSTENDLLYWGLDYPPLTAYHSYILGRVAQAIDRQYISLYNSRGYESKSHKTFMRNTVLIADIFIYLPAAVLLAITLKKTFNKSSTLPYILLTVIFPGQILIDNGHFQYNNISLGLAALAIASLMEGQDYLTAILYTLALNYKQMELYHALPFFFYLLKGCIFGEKTTPKKLKKFIKLSLIVTTIFVVLWIPWADSFQNGFNVLKRLFPIKRGVFENKVSNFWCSFNVVFKIRNIFSNEKMAFICLITTAISVLPINLKLFLRAKKKEFLYALTNTSLAFFLFSYQVHEKSILLVVLPAGCLIFAKPELGLTILNVACFSMTPLFEKDNLTLAFYGLYLLFLVSTRLSWSWVLKNKTQKMPDLFNIIIFILFLLSIFVFAVPASSKYPFLWPLLMSVFCCLSLICCFLYGIYIIFCFSNNWCLYKCHKEKTYG